MVKTTRFDSVIRNVDPNHVTSLPSVPDNILANVPDNIPAPNIPSNEAGDLNAPNLNLPMQNTLSPYEMSSNKTAFVTPTMTQFLSGQLRFKQDYRTQAPLIPTDEVETQVDSAHYKGYDANGQDELFDYDDSVARREWQNPTDGFCGCGCHDPHIGCHELEQAIWCELCDSGAHLSSLVVRNTPNGLYLEGVLEVDDDHVPMDIEELVRKVAPVNQVLNRIVVRKRKPECVLP